MSSTTKATAAEYADLVHSYGMFTGGQSFIAQLAELGIPIRPAPAAAVEAICPTCGSPNIARDASIRWNSNSQDWAISTILAAVRCGQCGWENKQPVWQPLGTSDPSVSLKPVVGARVRIRDRAQIGGDRFKDHEGEIVRESRFGFDVRLDMTSPGEVDKIERVEPAYLDILAIPTAASS